MKRTALVFGATGLVGGYVLKQLCEDDRYDQIKVFARREMELPCSRAKLILTDFDNLDWVAAEISGTDLFCCLGTTIKKAGSQDAQRKIDQQLPLDIAAIASRNHVQNYVFVSSIGAKASSSNFYLRIKGETEMKLHEYSFAKRVLVRPSFLLGPRKETRIGEAIGKVVIQLFGPLLFGKWRKYRGIHAKTVAAAMIGIVNSREIKSVWESDELHAFVKQL